MIHPALVKIVVSRESDIVMVRKAVREAAVKLGFGVTDVTRIVTAASELARNVFHYAGKGELHQKALRDNGRIGLCLEFIDEGPGIEDIEQAMKMGYTTRGGLGLGLPGAKRLMDHMTVVSSPGNGATITITKWRNQ
jgi:serine/threonine-protein kinase RsbT